MGHQWKQPTRISLPFTRSANLLPCAHDHAFQPQNSSAPLRPPLSSAARSELPPFLSSLSASTSVPSLQVFDVPSTIPGSPNLSQNPDHNNTEYSMVRLVWWCFFLQFAYFYFFKFCTLIVNLSDHNNTEYSMVRLVWWCFFLQFAYFYFLKFCTLKFSQLIIHLFVHLLLWISIGF